MTADAAALLHTPADYPDPAAAPALRWGILGAGGIARKFATDIPAHTASTIAAIGSRDLGRAQAFAAEMQVPQAYGSYEDLVADPSLDAIYIATPHSEHRDNALLALRAGKPVLIEKAVTRNAAEAREVFDAAASAGLFAMEAMWARFLPHYRASVDAVTSGVIGEVIGAFATHGQHLVFGPEHRLWNPALAGGALLDLGVYPVSFAHAHLGVPDEIHAHGRLSDLGVDTDETVILRYGDRTTAMLQSSMESAMVNSASIAGTRGRLDLARTFYAPSATELTLNDGTSTRVTSEHVTGGFEFEAAEAARCIAAGEQSSPLMTWQASVEVMQIMDTIREQLGVTYPGE
ncbi:Gfo/Idh/MocA family protein [Serinibacter salmoneus]|uniref:Putative dehydrogenase n=1 Tax=Serinibacter salmoneus TaxID=556530 RepID=A0A2A9D2P3_9MICO|nr:Gfo/Idh/MocA family oxidoreductase [Serinibacter salmoneus]PFG20651.1 putative dehydrogenase [Serinibacter salmoneus]